MMRQMFPKDLKTRLRSSLATSVVLALLALLCVATFRDEVRLHDGEPIALQGVVKTQPYATSRRSRFGIVEFELTRVGAQAGGRPSMNARLPLDQISRAGFSKGNAYWLDIGQDDANHRIHHVIRIRRMDGAVLATREELFAYIRDDNASAVIAVSGFLFGSLFFGAVALHAWFRLRRADKNKTPVPPLP